MDRIGRYPARSTVRAVHHIPKDSLKNKGTPETAQKIAAHASPRTTKLRHRDSRPLFDLTLLDCFVERIKFVYKDSSEPPLSSFRIVRLSSLSFRFTVGEI
jgi:hypothetical protein